PSGVSSSLGLWFLLVRQKPTYTLLPFTHTDLHHLATCSRKMRMSPFAPGRTPPGKSISKIDHEVDDVGSAPAGTRVDDRDAIGSRLIQQAWIDHGRQLGVGDKPRLQIRRIETSYRLRTEFISTEFERHRRTVLASNA